MHDRGHVRWCFVVAEILQDREHSPDHSFLHLDRTGHHSGSLQGLTDEAGNAIERRLHFVLPAVGCHRRCIVRLLTVWLPKVLEPPGWTGTTGLCCGQRSKIRASLMRSPDLSALRRSTFVPVRLSMPAPQVELVVQVGHLSEPAIGDELLDDRPRGPRLL